MSSSGGGRPLPIPVNVAGHVHGQCDGRETCQSARQQGMALGPHQHIDQRVDAGQDGQRAQAIEP